MKLPRDKQVDQTILNMELRIDVSYTKHRSQKPGNVVRLGEIERINGKY